MASADLAATLLEIVATLALFEWPWWVAPAGRPRSYTPGSADAAWSCGWTALSLATASIVLATTGPPRPLCEEHTSAAEAGPLATVDGHSLLPGTTTPPVTLRLGRPAPVLVGYLVNCASQPATLERIEVLNMTGTAATARSFWVAPTLNGAAPMLAGGQGRDTTASRAGWRRPHGVVVAPTWARPRLAVYTDLQPVRPGHFAVNALRVTVTGRDGSCIQPFATLIQVQVAGPDH